jgi:hypothetical protein
VRFDGWLDATAIGDVFVPARFPTPPGSGMVAQRTALTSRDDEVIASLSRSADQGASTTFVEEVTPIAGAPPGFQAVWLQRPSIQVRGFVPLAAYKPKPEVPESLAMWGRGEPDGAVTCAQQAVLVAGRGVFTSAGERVGVALSQADVWVGYRDLDGGDRLVAATLFIGPFGFVRAWLRTSDLKANR